MICSNVATPCFYSINHTRFSNSGSSLSNLKAKDTITFTGTNKNQNAAQSDVQRQAGYLAKRLSKISASNFNIDEIQKLVNEISPVNVNILPMSKKPGFVSNSSIAHMLPLYNHDFTLNSAYIYINNTAPQNAKERNILISDISHEFAHVLQRQNDKTYYNILNYTKDKTELQIIARASQALLQSIIRGCAALLPADSKSLAKRVTGNTDTASILKGIDINSYIENYIDTIPDGIFRLSKKDLKQAVKGWIKKEAQNETEAYTITVDTLKKSGKYEISTLGNRLVMKDIYQYIDESIK